MTVPIAGWVAPFGDPGINDRSHLPRAFRSVPRPSSPLSAKASTRCPSFASAPPNGKHQPGPAAAPAPRARARPSSRFAGRGGKTPFRRGKRVSPEDTSCGIRPGPASPARPAPALQTPPRRRPAAAAAATVTQLASLRCAINHTPGRPLPATGDKPAPPRLAAASPRPANPPANPRPAPGRHRLGPWR